MWPLLLRFWKPLAGVALLIGASLYLHHAGYESGYAASEAQWQPRFAEAARARDAANTVALRKEADSTALSQTAEAEHAKTVASLNLRAADADKRIRALSVRLAAGSARRVDVPALADAPTVINGPAAGATRADGAGASISDTGRRCELDAATITAWQAYYTELRSIIGRPNVP